MPTFSIIVPCYNLQSWISACLESVKTQSFTDWECIVVDDESKDDSGKIVDRYADADFRFKVIHKKNGGEGSSRNAGLEIATGDWVFFLDGDDVMAPDALLRLAVLIQKYPQESLFRFGFKQFEDGAPYPCVCHRGVSGPSVDISKQISYNDYYVYVWQFLFRRTLIEGMTFDRYKRGADRTFIVPVLCFRADSFVPTEDVFYFYRVRQGSAVNSKPSVQVLKDELSHRVDVIQAIDASGKRMSYCKTWWLENYCLQGYLSLVEGAEITYSKAEQRDLIAWFYCERRRFAKAKDFSLIGKVVTHLYAIRLGKLWRKMMRLLLWGCAFAYRVLSYLYRHYIKTGA